MNRLQEISEATGVAVEEVRGLLLPHLHGTDPVDLLEFSQHHRATTPTPEGLTTFTPEFRVALMAAGYIQGGPDEPWLPDWDRPIHKEDLNEDQNIDITA